MIATATLALANAAGAYVTPLMVGSALAADLATAFVVMRVAAMKYGAQ